MQITVQDLSHLSEHLDTIALLARLTPTEIDDAIVRILKIAAGDEVILEALAAFLNWLPILQCAEGDICVPEPELPTCLKTERNGIVKWRYYLRTGVV
jgi:hypothetical protein